VSVKFPIQFRLAQRLRSNVTQFALAALRAMDRSVFMKYSFAGGQDILQKTKGEMKKNDSCL
jgi:hypothetical protein